MPDLQGRCPKGWPEKGIVYPRSDLALRDGTRRDGDDVTRRGVCVVPEVAARAARRLERIALGVALGDRDDALHACGGMAGHRALVRVGALPEERDPQCRALAVREQSRLASGDLEVVLDRADVRDLEDDDAALRALLAQDELELLRGDVDACDE